MTVSDVVKKGIKSFVYFYDVTNKKSVNISYEGPVEGASEKGCPLLADINGPNPIEFETATLPSKTFQTISATSPARATRTAARRAWRPC